MRNASIARTCVVVGDTGPVGAVVADILTHRGVG